MDGHALFALFELAVSLASLVYTVRVWRSVKPHAPLAISPAERVCFAWNDKCPVGTVVAYEPEPFDPVAGRVAVSTLTKAYVKEGKPVMDVERFGTIELCSRVRAI